VLTRLFDPVRPNLLDDVRAFWPPPRYFERANPARLAKAA
jgi:hypothetical protein